MNACIIAAMFSAQLLSQIESDPITIELERPTAEIKLIPATKALPLQLAILDGYQLRVQLFSEAAAIIDLPPGTNAVDVFDADSDGHISVIAIHGNEVRLLRPASKWTLLFEVTSELGRLHGLPRLYPIVQRESEGFVCALPRKMSIEYRDFEGRLVREVSYDRPDKADAAPGPSFTRHLVAPPQLAGDEAIEFLLSARDYRSPIMTSNLPEPPVGRKGTLRQLRDAADQPIEHWPWMPLQPTTPRRDRVQYALDPPAYRNTLISVWKRTNPASQSPSVPGPKRRYPGIIVPPRDGSFDVDHDGYNDLLLWSSPLPGRSLRRLLGMASRTTWPFRLAVHLYRPERGLYDARPMGRIKLDIPTHWFLSLNGTTPLRNLVMADLDGDGRDDLAFSHDETSFEIRTATSNFAKSESFRFSLPKSKPRIEALARARNGRVGTIVLRGDSTLYVIRTPHAAAPATN